MSAHTSSPFQRRALGRKLKELRERTGLRAADVAKHVEISTGRLSRIENGEVAPDIPLAKCLLDLYLVTVNEWEPFLEQVRVARNAKGWWQNHGLDSRGYTALEAAASVKRTFELAYVPGLLQTEDHARTLFTAISSGLTTEQIERNVRVRMIRQKRLTSAEHPLSLRAIVDHAALHRTIGSRPQMRSQLRHLVEQSHLPTVDLRVVPPTVGAYVGMDGSFTLLSFNETDQSDVAYVEDIAGSAHIDKAEKVRIYKAAFDHLSAIALDPETTRAYILRAEREF